jgi:thermitase
MKKYLCLIIIPVLFMFPGIFGERVNDCEIRINSVASIGQNREPPIPNRNIPGNTDSNKQWAISSIMANQAWSITSGRPDIYIAILDTGIDEKHEDLIGQIVDRANFTSSPTTGDIYGHGTHIAGIVAASNNTFGITGLAYGCRLLNVKVADDGGWCDNLSIARGIRWATDRGAKVINISLYILKPSLDLEEAVNYAWNKGAIVVGVSGNSLGNTIVYPGYYANCIAVAGTNLDDIIPSWSGIGDWVHVAAPGTGIFSTMPNNNYDLKSGTSMSSAYVSGLAALLFSIIPKAKKNAHDNERIHLAIENSCDITNINSIGRINAFRAMNAILDNKRE